MRIHPVAPDDDRVTLDVNAATASSTCQLGVLPRGYRDTRFAVVLVHLFQDNTASGHVDTESECLGGENQLDEFAAEQMLDDFLEHGDQPGVVRGNARHERVFPLVETERR
ncbi:unannotated protein [freshwater metagenome]|uniref:Unannotated protein n=1 Tax=freshwater metagenome TaxID=449393 RepID=A0A6J6BWA3_9ZZZZ